VLFVEYLSFYKVRSDIDSRAVVLTDISYVSAVAATVGFRWPLYINRTKKAVKFKYTFKLYQYFSRLGISACYLRDCNIVPTLISTDGTTKLENTHRKSNTKTNVTNVQRTDYDLSKGLLNLLHKMKYLFYKSAIIPNVSKQRQILRLVHEKQL
jgi:hypothetical protein